MKLNLRTIFQQCLEVMLLPLARFCLRRSIKFQDFVEISKRAFVQSARDEMNDLGISQSTLRLSVMTGLQRRDVSRLNSAKSNKPPTQNPITRVIGQWANDRRFLDTRSRPRALLFEGKRSEFASLVKKISSDLNPYAVLFELERLGMVEKIGEKVSLRDLSYEPHGDIQGGFEMLATDTHDLIRAVEENVLGEATPMNLHAKTEYDNIDPEALPRIREWLLTLGERVHAEVRKYLSQHDRDFNPNQKEGGARVVFGAFSYTGKQTTTAPTKRVKKGGKTKQ